MMSSLSGRGCGILAPVLAEPMPAAEIALARASWQATVFAERPRRLALLELQAQWGLQPVRVSVLRNHAVEPVIGLLRPFLAYAGLTADVSLSGYDDSLSGRPRADADVHVVWLDPSRYAHEEAAAETLAARLRQLRRTLDGPMLLVDAPGTRAGARCVNAVLREAAAQMPDVYAFPYAAITAHLGADAIEGRVEAMGTPIAGEAAVLAAQHLGLLWIPAMVRPRVKSIIVDLDNTLIGGVLGEDGALGVRTGGAYARLRARLLRLHEQGVLLALVTKNELGDVDTLFCERAELSELRCAFATVATGWGSKSESVRAIASRLRIDVDGVLIVDDNPGEVAAMATALRDASFIIAGDPDVTVRALALHPGLLAVRADELGSRRAADLLAAERRATELQHAEDPAEYVRSLRMVARLRTNAAADLARVSALSRKTNQFNTALQRFTESDVQRYMTRADSRVVSIRLRDRLSDSGMIGAVFAHREGETAVIDEISVSCRALGRSIEGALLGAALTRTAEDLGCARVVIPFTAGPRNEPARAWLAAVANAVDGRTYEYTAGREDAVDTATRAAIELRWEDGDARRETP